MPNISERGKNAYSSPIRKLSSFADNAKKEGKHVFHLNIGQPDIKTPIAALEKIKNINLDVLAYGPAEGLLSYREKLVSYYKRFDLDLKPENFLITTGASEAILFAMLSCMDEGDEIIIPEPFYALYNGFSEIAHINVVPIPTMIENGFALPEISEFEKRISPRTKAIFICNPNNPTGCVYDNGALKNLAALVKEYDLYLIADEVYREFCYDGEKFQSILSFPEIEENAIVIDSISKRFSSCGARVGALVSKNKLLLDTVLRFARYRLCPPGLGQILAEGTLDESLEYSHLVKAEYDKRRKLLFHRLNSIPGIQCYLPKGAFYCFVKLPIKNAEHFCQWLLEDFDYQGNTIMLAPGEGFYSTKGMGIDEVRIAYVLNENDLNQAMDCLEKAIEVYVKMDESQALTGVETNAFSSN